MNIRQQLNTANVPIERVQRAVQNGKLKGVKITLLDDPNEYILEGEWVQGDLIMLSDIGLLTKSGEDLSKIAVDDLEISVRTANSLLHARVRTLADLSKMTRWQVLQIKNLGKKSLQEIESVLREHNIVLSGNISE